MLVSLYFCPVSPDCLLGRYFFGFVPVPVGLREPRYQPIFWQLRPFTLIFCDGWDAFTCAATRFCGFLLPAWSFWSCCYWFPLPMALARLSAASGSILLAFCLYHETVCHQAHGLGSSLTDVARLSPFVLFSFWEILTSFLCSGWLCQQRTLIWI